MFKKIILYILIISLSGCGYTSIYNDLNNVNLKFEIGTTEGDQDINNSLIRKFKRFSNNVNGETFIVNIKSSYKKIIASKDSTGNATDYKLMMSADFTIQNKGKTENINYFESINLTKMEDMFEEKQYELTIKENFASSISDKVIQRLSISK